MLFDKTRCLKGFCFGFLGIKEFIDEMNELLRKRVGSRGMQKTVRVTFKRELVIKLCIKRINVATPNKSM